MKPDYYPEKIKMEDGSVLQYRALVAFKCIYCGLLATVVEFDNGGIGVLHEQPYCSEFMAMDPDIFVKKNREKFEKDIVEGKVAPN